MRGACIIVLVALSAVGCTSLPDGGLPGGTYREAGGSGDAIVVDGKFLTVYLPGLQAGRRISPDGRTYSYEPYPDGILRIWGSSNDRYYLDLVQFCDWRWYSPAIECRRADGAVTRFERDTGGAAHPPALPQQQVWLAAAQHVLDNGRMGAGQTAPLPIYFRTSFPGKRFSIAQLERQAEKGFCGRTREEASGVVRALHWQNKPTRSIGDVFDQRPAFSTTDQRSGRTLGLSDVVFSREGAAYLNVDIGGRSGSIIRMEKKEGAWAWSAECASWTSY